MHNMLARCPVCNSNLHVSEMACAACGTQIRHSFERCPFCSLSQDQLEFVALFLRCRGDLGGVADEMDAAYSTVVRNLDTVLAALGIAAGPPAQAPIPPPPPPAPAHDDAADAERLHILEML